MHKGKAKWSFSEVLLSNAPLPKRVLSLEEMKKMTEEEHELENWGPSTLART